MSGSAIFVNMTPGAFAVHGPLPPIFRFLTAIPDAQDDYEEIM